MRFSLVTLFLVLTVAAVLSFAVSSFFQDDFGPDIQYLKSRGFDLRSFRDADGRAYLTSIGTADQLIDKYDSFVIGKQAKIGLLELSRCQFEIIQLAEMLQPEISHLVLDGVSLSPGLLATICAKISLLALDISCVNLSAVDFEQLCALPNLCLLRLSDVTAEQRSMLLPIAIRFPQVKIYCNAETLPLPDAESK